jgi:penicillin-binding protein 2
LVERVEGPDGSVIQSFPPVVRRRVNASPAHLDAVSRALRGVVGEARGTAHDIDLPEVEIAGKTGTAQVSRLPRLGEDPRRSWYLNRDHAWFAAFAPFDNPEIAIVVLVEHGGSGGSEAGPVVRQIVRDYFSRIRPGEPIPSIRSMRMDPAGTLRRHRARRRH